jgi:RsiW-degrading membrane proteinase PrsW (M82 family)
MLFALALIPVIGLLIFIYFNDKKEKEPIWLLLLLFGVGAASVVSAIVLELIGGLILGAVFPTDSVIKGTLDAMLIVAPAEELGKFIVLRSITWKNKHFNYSYDAIVYAVFVSLGFAALENITYVFGSGVGTAILRMFTAVPGHACFGVFMGFFYSKSKYASLTNKKGACAGFTALAILIPTIVHGIYDGILMGGGSSEEAFLSGISLILWILFVIALFVVSIIFVIRSSRHDFCIISLPVEGGSVIQTIYRPAIVGGWTCTCGSVNQLNFCPKCGKQRPVSTTWYCPVCATPSAFNFCGHCGCPRPLA